MLEINQDKLAGVPGRRSQIQEETQRFGAYLQELKESMNQLQERIIPILRPNEPKNEKINKDKSVSQLCVLAADIAGKNEILMDIIDTVNETIKRVEV